MRDARADDLASLTASAKAALTRVAPSIVQIETLGGLEKVDGFLIGTAPTSGVIVDQRGFVVSSAFNFKHAPSAILVTLPHGQKCAAKIVARDTSRMLVLLKLDTDETLTVPEAVPTDEIHTGQWAFAMGKTFDTQQPSISIGIVSATDRIWGRAIQTDAKTSPTNYGGPLADLRGRVFGVIVPLSPDSTSEVAGADQYDGGIGFAIPLVDVFRMLPRMIDGENIAPGLLGVSIKEKDLYAVGAPEIAYCAPKSPAALAGIRNGDQIVEIDGVAIHSQAAMKHAVGPHNAGDAIEVIVKRADDLLPYEITLVDKIEPYIIPFLGVIPDSQAASKAKPRELNGMDADSDGLAIRYVCENSAAQQAGLQPTDRLVGINHMRPLTENEWRYAIAIMQPGDKVRLTVQRDGKPEEFEVTLTSIPDSVPSVIAPSTQPKQIVVGDDGQTDDKQEKPKTGWVDQKLPEEPNACVAWIPQDYDADRPHGALIVTGRPGKIDRKAIESRWHDFCQDHDYVLLVPQSEDERGWQRSESTIIRKFYNRLAQTYSIDENRIAAFGSGVGGAMSYRFTFDNRDLVRGVATIDAVIPLGVELRGNDPVERLQIYTIGFKGAKLLSRMETNANALHEQLKFPVISRWPDGESRELSDDEWSELQRWLATLHRM